jgi:phosphohistidine phosphatase SixA
MSLKPSLSWINKGSLTFFLLSTLLINPESKAHQNFDNAKNQSTYSLIQQLQRGGKIIYMRHARTKTDWADQASTELSLDDCSTQRKLSSVGRLEATQIGNSLRNHEVPIGSVISSEYCRAIDTAQLSFGEHKTNKALNFLPCEVCTESDNSTYRERLLPLLSQSVDQGNNLVLVGHDDPFEAVTGIYPEPMGVLFIIEPKGNQGFNILGSIHPKDLTKLQSSRGTKQ